MTYILIVIGVIVIIVLNYGISTQCPSCKKLWSADLKDEKIVDKNPFYKTVTRKDIKKDRKGRVIETNSRQEQVHMIKEKSVLSYNCKKCSHNWIEENYREYEG